MFVDWTLLAKKRRLLKAASYELAVAGVPVQGYVMLYNN